MSDRIVRTMPRPGVALLTMDRPEKLNAMDPQFFAELVAVMADLSADKEVRAAVITGAGRAFSAGGDIDSFHRIAAGGDTDDVRRHNRSVYDAFCALERCTKPVIGAVNGIAYGGGAELTLACDIAVAGTSARFAFREVSIGLTPGWGIVRGPQVLGRQWTNLLVSTGRIIDADTARTAGFVVDVVPDADLVDAALDIAAEIAQHPSVAVQVGKAFLHRDTHDGFAESVEAVTLLWGTAEHRAAVDGFRSRRRRT
ncbi:enoyl-CoA hydratase [Nakamurella sp. YIM 132087]|uniref:Enoyl-CoA hydratase n=1 Tax=Nakamurella alba TaxID=2665158 RepID=A0A7K1FKN8_9ACTN|nr:enoyl-CoA hydratase/isomerase family protein [Nakamurella alba]MTD13434.1 enoyl-CoA hydratase [Nakamurella alba]